MAKKPRFEVGNQVTVSDAPGHTIYEIVEIFPDGLGCLIREEGLAPNGKPYREQRFDTSMLKHAVTDQMLKGLSFGSFKAGRKTTLSVPRRRR